MKLRGVQKIAAVLLGLERETAALLLKDLPNGPLDAITQAMVELSDHKLTLADMQPALDEFWRRIQDGSKLVTNFQDLLNSALGEERAKEHVRKLESTRERTAPLAPLEHLAPREVADVLQDENEQVCAIVLSLLKPKCAAKILECFPPDRSVEMIQRIANLSRPSSDLVESIAVSILERLGPTPPKSRERQDSGVTVAASILNYLAPDTEEELTGQLQQADDTLFKAIDEQRVTMDDLIAIDKKSMQKVLAGTDTRVLTLALKGVSKEIESAVLDNVSKRSRDNIMEERELLGAVALADVQKARQELLSIIRDMMKKGELTLRRGGSDDVVT